MSFSSVAPYSFTGIVTNPKDTAPFQIDLGMPVSFDQSSPAQPLPRLCHSPAPCQSRSPSSRRTVTAGWFQAS